MIQEIKDIISNGFIYQSVVNIAAFNEFARVELGVNLFKDQRINKGLAVMLMIYAPHGTMWITENKKNHGKTIKNRVNFCPSKAIEDIEKIIKLTKIKATPFLIIDNNVKSKDKAKSVDHKTFAKKTSKRAGK